ncbi:TPA: hypothetical protein N0F65_010232 [Lagenidium giganteum]|uniref:Reverse transcriptase domain-containing protein n=1 Tax=Lagenidium giganteum TaxID=4803 RepID=A0AAV2Z0L6_9STRA|nr:TPA: hypothetical protein N0F65_010232 [Lagenidium giganteum]
MVLASDPDKVIAKQGTLQDDSASGLDFRPIALLSTDYKLFTRVLANRLRPMLPRIVHPLQTRFVPGRDIHSTIDVFLALQREERVKPSSEACVLLLDFSKAYDTLRRDHLLAALKHAGLLARFRTLVDALHDGTSAVFLVNGFPSSRLAVTRGIRQGCPLAPLRFILALNPLYQRLCSDRAINGLMRTPSSLGNHAITVSGFADDTALYLRDAPSVRRAMAVLDHFGEESGLVINRSKSIVIRLGVPEEQLEDLHLKVL